jgi:transposase
VNRPAQPTLDELLALYAAGPDAMCGLVQDLFAQVSVLQLKVDELKARLDKDSHNSNNPPSSDGLRKPPAPASLRKRSGRKPGGQEGHRGSTLEYREQPDDCVECRHKCCDGCSYDLSGVESVVDETRQVFDVPPPPKLKCTQYDSHRIICPRCGKVCRGRFPAHITSEVQYGENIAATVVYLINYQFLPYKRTVELIRSLFNVSLSQGTVYNMCSRADYALEDVSKKVDEALKKSSVIHCDESGLRVCGMLYWLHLVSNKYFTAYSCQKQRGKLGMEEMGILNEYKGCAEHDGWLPYFLFACAHALCNVHHIRELIAVFENFQQNWAKDMIEVLLNGNEAVKRAVAEGKTRLSDYMLKKLNDRYDAAIAAGLEVNPSLPGARPGREKNTKRGALVRRLQRDKAETLAFLYNFEIPFDNNQAERDIRMIKAKQKISGGFRSLDGAEIFCRIRGYLSTMQKQGFDLFEAVRSVCRLDPIQPQFFSG